MNQTIVDAINQGKMLQVWWGGGFRTIQPHAYGVISNGRELLRCWQTDGYSRTNRVPAWKSLLVNDARDFRILEKKFMIHPEYREYDNGMLLIHAQLRHRRHDHMVLPAGLKWSNQAKKAS